MKNYTLLQLFELTMFWGLLSALIIVSIILIALSFSEGQNLIFEL